MTVGDIFDMIKDLPRDTPVAGKDRGCNATIGMVELRVMRLAVEVTPGSELMYDEGDEVWEEILDAEPNAVRHDVVLVLNTDI